MMNGRGIPGRCCCIKQREKVEAKAAWDKCKRKRQTLVFNPEEEVWHEPYMQCLRKEFSEISIPCDSKIELPWKDIALPAAGMKIRVKVSLNELVQDSLANDTADEGNAEKKESTGIMHLPWDDLLVTDTIQTHLNNTATCDSTLEIPWSDLALERPLFIEPPPKEESCAPDDIEIPWEEILVPQNIVIETKMKKHPSSAAPPRPSSKSGGKSCGKGPCCVKARNQRK
ncbi:uncharacterized protein LOC107265316 isoform X2 [Cephus cinctus]|nr:uncharacterized protein LOC107265316 isoform X2 [Cephus cinctus]